ncbi:MAG: PSD1 and planctomycete cytochrome C domain-containing protein, partial [Pirellulaceae bacterium]
CHNPKSSKAELDLTTIAGMRAGGESGKLVVAGKPNTSLLIQKVVEGEMPPEGKEPLTRQEIKLLTQWVQTGGKLAESTESQAISQWTILPILQLRCTVCHGTRKKEGGLDLRTVAAILKGGKSGPAIVPGKPAASLLLKRIHDGEMPPRRELVKYSVKPMDTSEVALVAKWIKQGATMDPGPHTEPAQPDPLVNVEDRNFWAFQPPQRPALPIVKSPSRLHTPVDHFIVQALGKQGLDLSPPADRQTLARRAYYDLLGLPPTPDELALFLADQAPDAYDRLLDRLLASPRYGERWGGLWLDLAGYADSEGIQHSDSVRPFAYRYRDYVIQSWNEDKPYSRFVMEQLAGDEMADYSNPDLVDQRTHDNLVATGFLRMVPDATYFGITNFVPDRLEIIDDILEVFSSSILGMTIKCARCHSHKFDPIPQRDYYRLAAIFKGAIDENDWLKPTRQGGTPGSEDRYLAAISTAERDAWQKHQQSIQEAIAVVNQRIQAEQARRTHQQQQQRIAKHPESLRADLARLLQTPVEQRDARLKELAEKYGEALKITREQLLKSSPDFKKYHDAAQAEIKSWKGKEKPQPLIRALWDRGNPSPTYILRRGNYLTPGRLVQPGFPAVLTRGSPTIRFEQPTEQSPGTGLRLALARWLVQPGHPLTSRVIANRIWKHHFQHGIVKSLDNFGRAGSRPTHPELLDWLALELVASGWSIKHLHRLIMSSATYRQQSKVTEEHLRKDPGNTRLSRMPLRRMDAEMLRDALLAVSGRLRLASFGPADPVEARSDGLVVSKPLEGGWRRSIYVIQRRTQPLTILGTFDRPQMNPNCVERLDSTVAPQALHLLNNKMIHGLAVSFAERVRREAGSEQEAQIRHSYLLALNRLPGQQEMELSMRYLAQLTSQWKQELPDQAAKAPQRALENFCHAVMNLGAFIYID